MPIDNLPDGVYMVNLSNPTEVDNFFRQIFGEKIPVTNFELGTPYDGDYPIAEDCSACDAKDCPIRKAPYGSTTPAPSLREAVERSVKDKALRDALKTEKPKGACAFVYVSDDELAALKALADGSATVIPTSKKDAVAKPTASPEPVWFHFIDPETGMLVVPMLNAWVVVKTGFVTTQVMQRVEADHERAIRVNHRPGGVSLWFNPKGDTFSPFDLAEAEWRYVAEPAPDMTGIPLNHLV